MSRVIAGLPEDREAGSTGRRGAGYEWGVLAGLGGAFALVSLIDVALTFYPLNFGSAEWEFGTATAVLNNLPLAVMGLGLVMVAGIGRSRPGLVSVAGFVAAALVLLLLVLVVMFGRNVGEALRSVTDPVIGQGLHESILRTTVQLLAYLAALTWMVVRARRD